MKYNFKNILDQEIYDSTRVILVTGKYQIFNNLVADTLKEISVQNRIPNSSSLGLSQEFGLDNSDEESASTSVGLDTFFDVADVANINGKWFCRIGLESVNKKQKDKILEYIKHPSRNAILVLMSTDFMIYKDFLKNRNFSMSQYVHLMQLSFPNKIILKSIVAMMFEEKNITPDSPSIEYFIMRLNNEYDKYTEVIEDIAENHEGYGIVLSDMKEYLKNIEYFDVDDFMYELVKPLSSDKTNNKKIIRMLSSLKDKYDAENLVYELVKKIDELIDYRVMINKGYITININYIFKDVIKLLGEKNKYAKTNEWVFRRKAKLASLTSLNDWNYMRLMLNRAVETGFPNSLERKVACERALYALVNRSVFSESRINNIIGLNNILYSSFDTLNRIVYDDEKIKKAYQEIRKDEEIK